MQVSRLMMFAKSRRLTPVLCLSMALGGLVVSGSPTSAQEALSLHDLVSRVVSDHVRIKAGESRVEASRKDEDAAGGGWAPDVTLTTSYGFERQNNASGSDTSMPPREGSLSLSQTLWDFGSTNAAIDRAELLRQQTEHTLESTRQNLMVEAINAYLELSRARRVMGFAQGSVENLKRQLDLENTRIERGAGVSTDRLQAKSQLAGAMSRLVRAEGALKRARNRYRSVYGSVPDADVKLPLPKSPEALFPPTLEEAVIMGASSNPQLLASLDATSIAKSDVDASKAAELRPTIDLTLESTWKEDVGGTVGYEQEQLAKVELSYTFDTSFANFNRLDATRSRAIVANNEYLQVRLDIEERVRNAWSSLETAKRNAAHLNDQADIAAEFLDRARKERLQGERSLIDILAGETSLINAKSDAASAETDVLIASFSVLAAIGKLDMSALQ